MEQVIEWVNANWQGIAGAVLALVTGVAIPATRRIMFIALRAILTERALIQLVIYLGDKIVASTKNNFDNTVWQEVRRDLFKEIK